MKQREADFPKESCNIEWIFHMNRRLVSYTIWTFLSELFIVCDVLQGYCYNCLGGRCGRDRSKLAWIHFGKLLPCYTAPEMEFARNQSGWCYSHFSQFRHWQKRSPHWSKWRSGQIHAFVEWVDRRRHSSERWGSIPLRSINVCNNREEWPDDASLMNTGSVYTMTVRAAIWVHLILFVKRMIRVESR